MKGKIHHQYVKDISTMYSMANRLDPDKFSWKPLYSFLWKKIALSQPRLRHLQFAFQHIGYALQSEFNMDHDTLIGFLLSIWSSDLVDDLLASLLAALEMEHATKKTRRKRYPAIDYIQSWQSGQSSIMPWSTSAKRRYIQIKCIQQREASSKFQFDSNIPWIFYWHTIQWNFFDPIPMWFLLKHPALLREGLIHYKPKINYMNEQSQFKHWNIILDVIRKRKHATTENIHPNVLIKYPQIAKAVLSRSLCMLKYFPEQVLIQQPSIAAYAVKHNAMCVKILSETFLQHHPDIAVSAAKQMSTVLEYIPHSILYRHPIVAISAVSNQSWYIGKLPLDLLMAFPDIGLAAVGHNYFSIKYIADCVLIKHPIIARRAIESDAFAIAQIREPVLLEHPDLSIAAIQKNNCTLTYIKKAVLLKHINIAITVMALNPMLFQFLPVEVQKHPCIKGIKFRTIITV